MLAGLEGERDGAAHSLKDFGVNLGFQRSLEFLSSIKVAGEEGTAKVKWVCERVAFSCVDPISLAELLQNLRTDLPQSLLHLVFQRRRLDATRF